MSAKSGPSGRAHSVQSAASVHPASHPGSGKSNVSHRSLADDKLSMASEHRSRDGNGQVAARNTSGGSHRSNVSNTSSSENKSKPGYVFMSYQWKHKELITMVRDNLEEEEIKVAIDIDPFTGLIRPTDQAALLGSSLVLIGLSTRYRDHTGCQAEAEFAFRMHKKIIFLQLEKDYFGSDWLRPMVEGSVVVDFTAGNDFDGQMKKLVEETHKEMKVSDIGLRRTNEFYVNHRLDRQAPNITGLIGLPGNKIVVSDKDNRLLKLFAEDGTFLDIVDNPQETWGITPINGSEFATCGFDERVNLWKDNGNKLIKHTRHFNLLGTAEAIHFNGKHFAVLHRRELIVTLLDANGREYRLIHVDASPSDGKRMELGWDVKLGKHKSDSIYLPIFREIKGVMCINFKGETLWKCPLPGRPSGIVLINDVICATDLTSKCVEMATKDAINRGTLLWNDFLNGQPNCIFHNVDEEGVGKVLLSYNFFCEKRNIITVFRVL